jgi:hypothetical protein
VLVKTETLSTQTVFHATVSSDLESFCFERTDALSHRTFLSTSMCRPFTLGIYIVHVPCSNGRSFPIISTPETIFLSFASAGASFVSGGCRHYEV